jgi:hypothetical protein
VQTNNYFHLNVVIKNKQSEILRLLLYYAI